MKQSSWACTLLIQLSLCLAIYVSLHLGQPFSFLNRQDSDGDGNGNGRHMDLCFISVVGGFRRLHQQTRLLKLMESFAKSHNAEFVVNISELGEEDPLLQNALQLASSLKTRWYTTGAPKENQSGYFIEHVKLPLGGSLDIIFIGTILSQQDSVLSRESSGMEISQLNWLTRTLKTSTSDWRIVVGSTPMFSYAQSKEPKEAKKVTRALHQILTKYGVDVYLSNRECNNGANQSRLACIVIPNTKGKKNQAVSSNEGSVIKREMEDGFLLHRVSSLEFVTYFINSSGQVIASRIVKQQGREVM